MKKKKILIVEDQFFLATHYKSILEQERDEEEAKYEVIGVDNYKVQCITTVSDAKIIIQKKRPDLILMDIKLTGREDGIDLAVYLQDLYDYPPPILFITGESNPDLNKRLLATTVYGYIKKPVDPFELCANVAMIFKNLLKVQEPTTQYLSIKTTKRQIRRIRIESIVYVDKSLDFVFLETDTIEVLRCTKSSIDQAIQKLPREAFIGVKQYLIAKYKITHLEIIPTHKKELDSVGKAINNQYGRICFEGETPSITLGRGAFKEIKELIKE